MPFTISLKRKLLTKYNNTIKYEKEDKKKLVYINISN